MPTWAARVLARCHGPFRLNAVRTVNQAATVAAYAYTHFKRYCWEYCLSGFARRDSFPENKAFAPFAFMSQKKGAMERRLAGVLGLTIIRRGIVDVFVLRFNSPDVGTI